MLLQSTALLHEDPKLPGAILSQRPKKVAITSRAKEIDLKEEMGMAISIPRNAAVREEQIQLTASFSGAYKLPEDVTSVSPAYIIETSREVEFRKDVEVKLQHTARLQTAEDRQDVMVMKASNKTPSQRGKFEEIVGAKLEFIPHYVKMKVKSIASSVFRIGRRKRSKAKGRERVLRAAVVIMSCLTQKRWRSTTLQGCTSPFAGLGSQLCFVCAQSTLSTLRYMGHCSCLYSPLEGSLQHCDKVVAQCYPDMADKAKATFFNALIIKSDQVQLIKDKMSVWKVNMDRSMVGLFSS